MFRNQHGSRLDRGAAAVEMALVLPLLLLVLFGLVDFGRAFNTKMQLTQAAREAVRVVAIGGSDLDAATRAKDATGGLTLGMTFQRCSATPLPSENATVTVTYSFEFKTPLGPVAGLFGASTLPGIGTFKTLSSSGVMRCSG